MKWFRLWTDILDDTKLSQLEDGDYRRFIGLLAMASEEDKAGLIPYQIDKIAWRLRCRRDHLEKSVNKLINLNILKQNGNGFLFLNWEKRQFQSDNSTQRWRKWKANVGPTLAPTPPDTDTDTETDKPPLNTPPRGFDIFWKDYPKKIGKGAALKAWKKIEKPSETAEKIIEALAWQKKLDQWTKDNGQFIPHPATYLNQRRWEDEKETGIPNKETFGTCSACKRPHIELYGGICVYCKRKE